MTTNFKRGDKAIYTRLDGKEEECVILFPKAAGMPGYTVVQFSPQQHDGLTVNQRRLRHATIAKVITMKRLAGDR
jgi:hypothetical protein